MLNSNKRKAQLLSLSSTGTIPLDNLTPLYEIYRLAREYGVIALALAEHGGLNRVDDVLFGFYEFVEVVDLSMMIIESYFSQLKEGEHCVLVDFI